MYHGSMEERKAMSKKLNVQHDVKCEGYTVKSYPVIVTSYEVAMRDRDVLQRRNWEMVVIDEGHRIKNHQCRLGR
jgi:ATP-dependent DNA helicase